MGFERLSSVVAKAAEARSQDFNARLTKAAFAYVGFAVQHPALFALMFEAKRRPGMLPEAPAEFQVQPQVACPRDNNY